MRHKTYPTSLTLSLSRSPLPFVPPLPLAPPPGPPLDPRLLACLPLTVVFAVVIVVAVVVVVGHDMTARNMMKGPID